MTNALAACGFALATPVFACASGIVVVPNTNENSPGPSNQGFPFNSGSPFRYQQVYAADQFGTKSGLITQFAYRPDESAGDPFTSNQIDCEIRLSHTTAGPNTLSTTFADNIGPDETLVFDGLLSLSSADNGTFDIIVDINDLFVYNGVDNLLIEIKIFNSPISTQFDAAGTGLGQGGTPWTDRLWALGDPNAVTGSSGGDDGMVTQFTIIPAPGALALLGVAGVCGARRRRHN
jgi:hypothetical protein